uniref:Uncharacterized protein n=1 Tax=Micrurus surinamensis TaxID=129470 RepID=A0A2D4P9F1_MICSU
MQVTSYYMQTVIATKVLFIVILWLYLHQGFPLPTYCAILHSSFRGIFPSILPIISPISFNYTAVHKRAPKDLKVLTIHLQTTHLATFNEKIEREIFKCNSAIFWVNSYITSIILCFANKEIQSQRNLFSHQGGHL